MKIILAGGTGLIGRALTKRLLEANHSIVLLVRNPEAVAAPANVTIEQWDGKTPGAWTRHLDDADALINLAGESIADKRWTERRKAILRSSRIDPTRALVDSIATAKKKPEVLINASAVGFYGAIESGDVDEGRSAGDGYLARLCAEWEGEAMKTSAYGTRVVLVRTGIVLEKNGGALKKMVLPFKLFAGGPIGGGRQWMPWIHVDDEVGIILFALENKSLSGPVNASAPNPVTMGEFSKSLGHVIHRPSWAPVPGFVLKVALGELSGMVLTGQRAVPQKLLAQGYVFKYAELDEALSAIFGN